ncbi:MAG TPA: hypothetical protein H9755_07125 [Candidatus Dietzia intestinigallinarum]|nr:hypothetical protein [Candidatus Dietzia intestinigallinarum]
MAAGVERTSNEPSGSGLVRGLLTSILPVLGALAGCVLGWYTSTWAVHGFRDVFGVAELSGVPVRHRAPGVPGPTAGYWLSWAVPIGAVYVVSALLLWRWRHGRLLTGAVIVGFSVVVLFLVPTWVSMEVGGFAPT